MTGHIDDLIFMFVNFETLTRSNHAYNDRKPIDGGKSCASMGMTMNQLMRCVWKISSVSDVRAGEHDPSWQWDTQLLGSEEIILAAHLDLPHGLCTMILPTYIYLKFMKFTSSISIPYKLNGTVGTVQEGSGLLLWLTSDGQHCITLQMLLPSDQGYSMPMLNAWRRSWSNGNHEAIIEDGPYPILRVPSPCLVGPE